MANRYLKSIGGNWSAAGTWSATGAGGGDSVGPPTAADDVILELLSGNVTIDAGAVCRSLDCTSGTGSYVGTITHNAAATLTIGAATAGTGNIALRLVAGLTYTLGNTNTSALSFVSTSATQQTLDFGGKNHGSMTFDGAGSSYILSSSSTSTGNGTTTLTQGIFNTNGQTCSWGFFNSNNSNTRTLTMGASAITITTGGVAWNTLATTGLTVTANTATITVSAAAGQFTYGTINYNGTSVIMSGSGAQVAGTGTVTLANFTRTGTALKTDSLNMTGNLTVTGTLTLTGNSTTNRLLVSSANAPGTARTITAAAVSLTNVDFADITGAGAAAPFTGTSMGNALGNSGITFDTPATQTHTASAGGNWSDVTKWTSRVPLPQDDVIVDVNTTGTLSMDMPRLGKNLNFTGHAATLSGANIANSLYGDLTLTSTMTLAGGGTLNFAGRGSHTITSAGKTWAFNLSVSAPGGTYTLQDALASSNGAFTLSDGTFTANNFNVTCLNVVSNSSRTRTLNMGSGTWSAIITTASNFWTAATAGLTLNAGTSTIVLSTASTNARTFTGAGLTYNNLTYTVPGSTGQLTITGSNTFNTINFSDITNARTLTLTSGTTQTITGTFNVNGTAGKLMTINSSTPGTPAILSKASGTTVCDYLSIQDSTATGGAAWYAGANSVNVSGNSGWFFRVPFEKGNFFHVM